MKTYVLYRADGGVEIMRTEIEPVICIVKWHPSRQAELSGVIQEITEEVVPKDRTFRNAWKATGTLIECDMIKAREIHRESLRRKRRSKFEFWDAEWMKSMAAGNSLRAAEVEAKRQALRDAPIYPAIDAATTPEELKAAVPPILIE